MPKLKNDLNIIYYYWWLRSAHRDSINYVGCVYGDGLVNDLAYYNFYGVAPICIL